MLSNLFGAFADSFFQGIGAAPIKVRYRNTAIIAPTPIVSHEGVHILYIPSILAILPIE